jgi:hypothetical protein
MFHRFKLFRQKLKFNELKEQKLQATTLDAICTEVDILKLDTQGSELDILKGGTNLLKTVSVIRIETEYRPFYVHQPLFKDIVAWLSDFELVHVYPRFLQSDEGIEPVDADCIFVRKRIAPRKAEALRLMYPWFTFKTVPPRREYALWRFRFT